MDAVSIIVIVVLILVIVYSTKIYNNLVTLKHAVSKAWVNIETALKQRHDQLPQLIDLCKQHEVDQPDLFEKILATRTQVMNAQQMGQVQSLAVAEEQLQNYAASLLEIAGEHSELNRDEKFQALVQALKDTELTILDRCELYNNCVNTSNDRIEQFPESFIASFFSFGTYDLLVINAESKFGADPEE